MSENELARSPEATVDVLATIPPITQDEVDLSRSVRIAFDKIPSLGTAFASLPETFRTVTTTVTTQAQGGTPLFYVTDAAGNILSPEMLQQFKDGSGLLGSTYSNGTFAQARLHAAEAQQITQTATTVVPFDPTTMFLAAALMQVNHKLDAISNMQKEMFAYAKQRDRAKIVGAIEILNDIRETYRYNSDNMLYLQAKATAANQAMMVASNAIALQREELKKRLSNLGPIHTTDDVVKKTDEMVWSLRDYQLATYLYAYSTLVEVILTGNYESDYLSAVTRKMERFARQYADMYKKCLDAIKRDAKGAVGARLTNGMSKASRTLGNLVAATPVGKATPIDEALIHGSTHLRAISYSGSRRSEKALAHAKPGAMKAFIDSVHEIDRLHNEPVVVAVGSDAVYLLPSDGIAVGKKTETVNKTGDGLDSQRTHRRDMTPNVPAPSEISGYLLHDGSLRELPTKYRKRLAALWWLASRLDRSRIYTEQELNSALDELLMSHDHAAARRELVDHGLLSRTPDGKAYSFAGELISTTDGQLVIAPDELPACDWFIRKFT